jgi:chitinase
VTGNATLGQTTGTGTIRNDDLPTITIYNQGIYEGSSGSANANFTVYLSAASTQTVTVNYATADGTATAGSDYAAVSGTLTFAPGQTSASISVPVYGDTVDEADELYYVNLSNPVNATLANTQGRGTIYNDDLSISVSDAAAVTEGNSGSTPAYFTVSLSAASTHTVTVSYYTNGGTATAGSDYTSTSGTLTFNPGQTSITVPVYVLGDTIYEVNETFSLWLTQASNALINRISGTATIVDDDPSTTISISDASALEGNSGTSGLTFTVTLNAASTQTVTVNYATAAGTATAGTDYQSLSGTLSFAPGQTSKTVTVYAIGDTLQESNETFTLNLSGATNATISRAAGTGTIIDDDSPGLSVGNVSVVEGNSGTVYAVFTVTLSAVSGLPATTYYQTIAGTATSGTDYYATSGYIYIPVGQTSATVSVAVRGDTTIEADETFTLNLYSPGSATLGRANGTGTIINDDFPVVSVAPASLVEGNSGTSYMAFTLSLSASSPQTISVNYATGDIVSVGGGGPIPATTGVDYQATTGTATFAPGQTTATVLVPIYGDKLVEPDEAFGLGLSNPVNVTLSALPGNYGTILNDDHAPVANAGPNQTVNEGVTVQFDGSGSSDADGDALSYFWSFGDGSGASGVNPTHVFADNGVYTVTLTISDGANTSSSTLTVTVQNVAPTLAVSGPTDAVPGQDRTIALSATDPSSADQAGQFTYQITWGDGTTQTVQGPASGIQVTHVFTTVGSVSVSATATDKDGGTSAAVSQTVTVIAAELQGGDLIVGGTTGDDHVVIQPTDTSGTVDVVLNGLDLGTFVPTGKVVVYGQAGNDLIEVVPLTAGDGSTTPLAVPVMLFGGDGDDTLDARGASGPVVLSGGAGNDTLWGGSGRNLLFGGSGSDVLHGGNADDLLIGGASTYDANVAALLALQAEWNRTDADYLTRSSDLNGTSGGGLNGTYVLNGLTVVDDAAVDSLFGNAGQDWFFAASSGANPDQVNDLEAGEQVTLL